MYASQLFLPGQVRTLPFLRYDGEGKLYRASLLPFRRAVYFILGDEALWLYIGSTERLGVRLHSHPVWHLIKTLWRPICQQICVHYVLCDRLNRGALLALEEHLIANYRPRLNKTRVRAAPSFQAIRAEYGDCYLEQGGRP